MKSLVVTLVGSVVVVLSACSGDPPGDGACAEGATRPCHVVLAGASGGGVLSCISGSQTCSGGAWGACVGDGTIISRTGYSGPGDSVGGLHTLSVTGSQQCQDDPCNPDCYYFSGDDGGISAPDASGGVTYQTGGVPLSDLPTGWTQVNKSPCQSDSDCEFDSHCVAGACTLYAPGDKGSCNGIDFTAQSACSSGSSTLFPICNRGTQDATSGTVTVGFDMNPPPSGVCAPVTGTYPNKGSCVVDLAKTPIPAGQCIDVDPVNKVNVKNCNNVEVSGNRDFFVNYDNGFSECNHCNNEGVKKAGTTCQSASTSTYPPKTYTQTYVATCPAGQSPVWTALAWVATTPSSGGSFSNVTFQGQLADLGTDGGPTTFGTAVTLGNTPAGGDPGTCGLFGPPPCPKDLTTIFGGPTFANKPALKLTITLTPSTDGLAAPSVSTWQLTYDCVDST